MGGDGAVTGGMSRLLLVLVGVAIAAGVLELGAYLWFTHKGFVTREGRTRHLLDPFRGHRLNPEYAGWDSGGRRLHSGQGFRGERTFSPTKPPGTYRIVLEGASTAYGLGSDAPYESHPSLAADETLDAQLERTLRTRLDGRPVEVINAATPAYRVFQQLVYLNESLLAYGPDLVLLVEGHNDFYRADAGAGPWMDYPYSSVLWVDGLNRRSAAFTALVVTRWLARYSWFMTGVEARLTTAFEDAERGGFAHADFLAQGSVPLPDAETFRRVARDNITRHYLQIAVLGRLYGYRTAVVLQPEVVLEDPASLGTHDRAIQDLTLRLTGTSAERARAIEGFVPWIAEAATAAGTLAGIDVAFFDHHRLVAGGGDAGDGLYYDHCHLSPTGSRRLAEAIARDVVPVVAAP